MEANIEEEEATQLEFRSGLSQPKPEDEMGFQFDQFNFISAPPLNTTGNTSFTALLELPPPQAVQLLVKEDFPDKFLPPIFPSNFPLIDSVSNFSTFDSLKQEQLDTDSDLDPKPDSSTPNQSNKCTKRKEREKKVKESNKKGKKVEETNEEEDKLPYVHVRARRGQATDSHSLAERARREKINARMKLLQDLVPGCKKVSGTAMVLDEIINHVQALQRQVEFLSMRLAAVDPRIDFNLDALLAAENDSYTEHIWSEGQIDRIRQQEYQQLLHVDGLHQPNWNKEEEEEEVEEDTSKFMSLKEPQSIYDHSTNSGSLHSSQLKMEL